MINVVNRLNQWLVMQVLLPGLFHFSALLLPEQASVKHKEQNNKTNNLQTQSQRVAESVSWTPSFSIFTGANAGRGESVSQSAS